LLDYLDASPLAKETLVAVLGLRGLALGEHRRVGAWDDALCGETIHVPWLLRFPDCVGAMARTQALVQPPDLGATLADWWSLPGRPADAGRFARSLLPLARDEVLTLRDRTCSISPAGERGLRTRAWYLRSSPNPLEGDPSGSGRALYAKPDDRFEINDVAARCEDVVVALEAGANEFQRLASQSQLDQLPSLDEELVTEMRS
jgi:hypothetical protein